ncbi:MAG: glycosyltransferase [Cyanobacteria bacterium J06614_10]
MKRVMLYCQHLVGMGHLVRSTEIVLQLVSDFEVCFINGGKAVPNFQFPPAVKIISLPALVANGPKVEPLDANQSLEHIQAERKQQLLEAFEQFSPDCVITECFPFSKLALKQELKPLLQRAKSAPRPVKVICSLRDLIMTQPIEHAARERRVDRICRLVSQYYDAILYHADESFQRLEDSFPAVGHLDSKVIYTGYVAQQPAPTQQPGFTGSLPPLQIPNIVASVGGGKHGYPLLSAILKASDLLAQVLPHQIYAFAGPFMPEAEFEQLQKLSTGKINVILQRYTPRLIDYLQQTDLSISLGGYNTTMNLLRTGVRSLVFPSPSPNQTDEQRIRAQGLARLKVINLLSPAELSPLPLVTAIQNSLRQVPATYNFNLNGAENTAKQLKALLETPVAVGNRS